MHFFSNTNCFAPPPRNCVVVVACSVEIVESDHARSDSDVADSYDDEHLSASVSEDENGDDASDSQLDVASSEQEEEHALKEGGATPANKDEYTSVQKEQAELMEFCQSRPLPAVENVAATQIQELTRNPTVQQHQRVRGCVSV